MKWYDFRFKGYPEIFVFIGLFSVANAFLNTDGRVVGATLIIVGSYNLIAELYLKKIPKIHSLKGGKKHE